MTQKERIDSLDEAIKALSEKVNAINDSTTKQDGKIQELFGNIGAIRSEIRTASISKNKPVKPNGADTLKSKVLIKGEMTTSEYFANTSSVPAFPGPVPMDRYGNITDKTWVIKEINDVPYYVHYDSRGLARFEDGSIDFDNSDELREIQRIKL